MEDRGPTQTQRQLSVVDRIDDNMASQSGNTSRRIVSPIPPDDTLKSTIIKRPTLFEKTGTISSTPEKHLQTSLLRIQKMNF